MIEEFTVFILGAGDSQPYGYPTGSGLRVDIITNLNNDLNNLLKKSKCEDKKDWLNAATKFQNVFKKSSFYSMTIFS